MVDINKLLEYNANMVDITGADDLEIQVDGKENGSVVRINVNGICVFRACQVKDVKIEWQGEPNPVIGPETGFEPSAPASPWNPPNTLGPPLNINLTLLRAKALDEHATAALQSAERVRIIVFEIDEDTGARSVYDIIEMPTLDAAIKYFNSARKNWLRDKAVVRLEPVNPAVLEP